MSSTSLDTANCISVFPLNYSQIIALNLFYGNTSLASVYSPLNIDCHSYNRGALYTLQYVPLKLYDNAVQDFKSIFFF